MLENGIYTDRDKWINDLDLHVSTDDLNALFDTDKEALFDGMCEFFSRTDGAVIMNIKEESKDRIGATASLLIPGARIFIRFDEAIKTWSKRLIRTVALFAIVGTINPLYAFAGLSVDFVIGIFEKLSRLDEADVMLVNTILELSKLKEGKLPSTAEIVKEIEAPQKNVETRLDSLKVRSIIRQKNHGWQVEF